MDVGCTGMQEIVHVFQKDMQGGRDIRKYQDSVRLWAGTFDMQKTVPVIWKIPFCIYPNPKRNSFSCGSGATTTERSKYDVCFPHWMRHWPVPVFAHTWATALK